MFRKILNLRLQIPRMCVCNLECCTQVEPEDSLKLNEEQVVVDRGRSCSSYLVIRVVKLYNLIAFVV